MMGWGFKLVPWRPALEQQLGQWVTGVKAPGGNVDWNFGAQVGIGNFIDPGGGIGAGCGTFDRTRRTADAALS